jgi:kynureninase
MNESAVFKAARELDQQDPLAPFRSRFVIDDPELIYLDGNSLGRLPIAAVERAQQIVRDEWGCRLIRGWSDSPNSWMDLAGRIGDKIGGLVGAEPGELRVADSTSVNLFKLAVAALRAQPGRSRLITDDLNFPSDVYILQAAIEAVGGHHRLEIVPSSDGITTPLSLLETVVDEHTALVALSHTAFKSAFVHDMTAVNHLAHQHGALILWDLSHSAGAVQVELRGSGADLAVGCTYKYLNGGPGAPAFLYVRRELQDRLENPISGWLGHADPFSFVLDYAPAEGIRRFMTGSPPIASTALVEPGVDLLLEAGMEAVRAKSVAQTSFLLDLWETELKPLGFELRSPRAPERRGSHLALGHPEAWRICQALIAEYHVIPDFRVPDNLRLGVAPLYNTFEELAKAMNALRQIVEERRYARYTTERTGVT